MVEVKGYRLRQARVLRNLTSTALADALGWTPTKVSRAQNAYVLNLSEDKISELCRATGFPEPFFRQDLNSGLDARDMLFRKPLSTPKREIQFLTDYAAVLGDFAHYLDAMHRLPNVILPAPTRRPVAWNLRLEEATSAARESLRIAENEPVPYLTHLLERAGVVVSVRSGSLAPENGEQTGQEAPWGSDGMQVERYLGYSCWTGPSRDRPAIVMRQMASWERTRWTLAHELGHLCLHVDATEPDTEDQAHDFAAEFLAPINALKAELPSTITLLGLLPLKLKWGLSLYALIRHLRSNAIITDAKYTSLTDQLHVRRNIDTGKTWRKDEPGWDAREAERPALLSTWSSRLLGSAKPEAVAAVSNRWPSWLIAEFVGNQRSISTEAMPDARKNEALTRERRGENVVSLFPGPLRAAQ